MRNLNDGSIFEALTISAVEGDPLLTRRLRELGFQSGSEVRLLGRAPFKGPVIVQLEDSVLALRRLEAECLRIK